MAEFDVVILGGGSGGYACALRSAQLGKSVLLIESGKLGGTCLHRGCIPTKALLHSAEIADNSRDANHYGVNAQFLSMDMPAVNAYKDGVVSKLHKGLQGLVKSRNMAKSGEVDPLIQGKKILAIFGFCDIRNFTDATEVL